MNEPPPIPIAPPPPPPPPVFAMDKPVTMEALSAPDKKAEKERKKAEAAAKKAARDAAKKAEKEAVDVPSAASISLTDISAGDDDAAIESKLTKEQQRVRSNRAVTGVLASVPAARDVKIDSFSVSLGGRSLVARLSR